MSKMNYVMSDLHGDYGRYQSMLKLIDLRNDDQLYILGDVIDRGDGGIRILRDMMLRMNVFPILGNHEYMMARCAHFLLQEITEETIAKINADMLQGLTEWMNVGGSATIRELSRLSAEEREDVLDYVGEFALFEEVRAAEKKFVLVHAGLEHFDVSRRLDSYDVSELIFKAPFYERKYFEDKYLVTGHLPTRVIWAEEQGQLSGEQDKSQYKDDIFIKNNHIAIDCGCGYDGRLGCICLETFEEYYV